MNDDPTFATRAELAEWAGLEGRAANMIAKLKGNAAERHAAIDGILARVSRVTLAHMHLPFGGKP